MWVNAVLVGKAWIDEHTSQMVYSDQKVTPSTDSITVTAKHSGRN